MIRMGAVWVRHERGQIWHRTVWQQGGLAVVPPACGARAERPPAWIPWLRPGSPPLADQCLACRSFSDVPATAAEFTS